MKKVLLTISLVAFAVAVQAGEAKTTKTSDKEKSCCSQAKATACEQTKATSCEQTKATSCEQAKETASCCSMKTQTKQALLSPKAAGEVAKKL